MAEAVELLKQAKQEKFQSRRGRKLKFELLPPLSEREIAAFAAGLPGPLPAELRRLLAFAGGFTIEVDEDWPQDIEEFLVDFTGADESLSAPQDSLGAMDHPACIAADVTSDRELLTRALDSYNPKYNEKVTVETVGEMIVVRPAVVFAWRVEHGASFVDEATRFTFGG